MLKLLNGCWQRRNQVRPGCCPATPSGEWRLLLQHPSAMRDIATLIDMQLEPVAGAVSPMLAWPSKGRVSV
jgi:hypothetical protein